MTIHERYGRLQEQYETECEAHRNTVAVLRGLKSGEISLDSLSVTEDNQWAITTDAETVADELPN